MINMDLKETAYLANLRSNRLPNGGSVCWIFLVLGNVSWNLVKILRFWGASMGNLYVCDAIRVISPLFRPPGTVSLALYL